MQFHKINNIFYQNKLTTKKLSFSQSCKNLVYPSIFQLFIFRYNEYFQETYLYNKTPMIVVIQDKEFSQLRKVIYQKYIHYIINDQEHIQKQIQIMQQCRQKLDRRRSYQSFNNISLNITNISSIQNMSSTDESSFRNKFTEQFENSILNSAIKEIKTTCSEETFDTIMGYVLNNKNKEYEDVKRDLDKKNKEYQELAALIIIKQKDITFLERDLSNLRTKEQFLEEQKKRVKKKTDLLDQKQKRLHGAEMSLIFKQKLNLQGKRRYQRQKDSIENTIKQYQKIYSELNKIWDKILQAMQTIKCGCENNCWKSEVMKKCKQQLVEQRKILLEQQKQIQNEYQNMRNLSEQIKKVWVTINPDSKKLDDSKK